MQPTADDLPPVVDTRCDGESPAGAGRQELVQVGHFAVAPHKSMRDFVLSGILKKIPFKTVKVIRQGFRDVAAVLEKMKASGVFVIQQRRKE